MKIFNAFLLLFFAVVVLHSCKGPKICCGPKPDVSIDAQGLKVVENSPAYVAMGVGSSANQQMSLEKARAIAKHNVLGTAIMDYRKSFKNYADNHFGNDTLITVFRNYMSSAAISYLTRNDTLIFNKSEQIKSGAYRTLVVITLPEDSLLQLTRQYIKEDSVLSMDKRNYLLQFLDKK